MIINFSVQNFGPIKDEITLSFEASNSEELEEYYIIRPKKGLRLLKLGLIFGANASGKTNVLEALDFLRGLVLEPLDNKTGTIDFKPFLFDPNTPKENSFFTLELIQNEVKYLYKVELNQSAVVNEKLHFYNPNKALVFERKTDLKRQLSSIQFGGKISITKEHKAILEGNTLWNNTVLGGFLKTNIASHELQEIIDWFKEKFKSVITPETDLKGDISKKIAEGEIDKENLVELLKKADLKITDVIIKETEFPQNSIADTLKNFLLSQENLNEKIVDILKTRKVFFQHTIRANDRERTYTIPYADESLGTQRYYQISGLLDLMIRTSGIFSIDELDSSLHPDLLDHFLLVFLVNVKDSQLIATTHHRELLMKKDILRNDAIWFTEKKPDGSSDLYSLDDFDSSVIRDTSSVYNAYKIGKLGAVPELSDFYL